MGTADFVASIDGSGRQFQIQAALSNGIKNTGKATDQTIARKCFKFIELCLVWVSGAASYRLMGIGLRLSRNATLDVSFGAFAGLLLLTSILTILFCNLRGLYVLPWRGNIRRLACLQAEAVASAGIVACSCMYLWNITVGSKPLVVTTLILTWVLLVAWRKFIEAQPIIGLTDKRNVLIAGCDQNARLLRAHLERNPDLGFVVKGYLDRRQGPRPANQPPKESEEGLLGGVKELPSIVRTHFIDEIFVRLPRDRHLVKLLAGQAFASGVNVRVVPDLWDGWTAERSIEFVGAFPTITLHQRPSATWQLLGKRLVDVLVSGMALLALMPFLALLAAIIKLDSKGRVLYKSVRVGKKGQTFTCFKFRTMVQNAEMLQDSLSALNERSGPLFKIADDPRITRVGKVLRKYSLDELPQFWNVLKGEMSLVGPRPCVPSEFKQYTLEHLHRLDVVPGITGLWQVEARRSPSFEEYLSLDKRYVDDWNLGLDFKIMWRTAGVVLAGTGQ